MTKGKLAIVLLSALLLSACGQVDSRTCNMPPKEDFSESDLIGTWGGAGIETDGDSIIIIREDGRYKQIIHIERTGFKYEGDWKAWRVTYSNKGLPYLHLEGLLMCAYWDQMDCTGETNLEPIEVGDTLDPFASASSWYNPCLEEWVDTPGEGVFMVWESPRHQRGIELVPFTRNADSISGPSYNLKEP